MKGDIAAVRVLIQQKADVNAPQADGATAVQWAAYRDDLRLADLLIGAGANVQAANREGATPLYLAAIQGSAGMVEKLLKAGANANGAGPQGETPLMLAARSGNLDSIRLLLNHDAQVNAKEKLRGTTPLMWAVEQSHPAAVKLLIEHGADVNASAAPDAGGKPRNNLANPRSQRVNSIFGTGSGAAQPKRSAAEVAAVLTAAGIDPKIVTGFGLDLGNLPPGLDLSALIQQISEAGFGGTAKDGGGLTALVLAAREDCLECAQLSARGRRRHRPSHRLRLDPAAHRNAEPSLQLAAYLLEKGANPNIANSGGWTPLYLATDNRNIESGDYPVRTPDMDHLEFIKLLR